MSTSVHCQTESIRCNMFDEALVKSIERERERA